MKGTAGKAQAQTPAPKAAGPQQQALAVVSEEMMKALEADAGEGFEGAGSQDFAIPFVGILQSLSPQVDPTDVAHIEGATVGMFHNSATGQISDKIRVIVSHYKRSIVEWKPDRGGFVAQHEPGKEPKAMGTNDRGVPTTEADGKGNLLVDTRYFGCVLIDEDGNQSPVIIPMASSQLKVAKNWMSRMDAIKVEGPHGKFKPPMYSSLWELSSVKQENDKGKWFGFKVERLGAVEDMEMFKGAKQARDIFATTTTAPPLLLAGEAGKGEGVM